MRRKHLAKVSGAKKWEEPVKYKGKPVKIVDFQLKRKHLPFLLIPIGLIIFGIVYGALIPGTVISTNGVYSFFSIN